MTEKKMQNLQMGGLSSKTEYKWKADGKPTHSRFPITSKVTAGTGKQISFFLWCLPFVRLTS